MLIVTPYMGGDIAVQLICKIWKARKCGVVDKTNISYHILSLAMILIQ
jgi:hypothetical protein